MTSLDIPVEVAGPTTGMVQAILAELNDHLPELASSGKQHVIDLTSLPMTESDKRELETRLGRGELSITLSTIGDSQIFETGYSGVWWVKHYTSEQKLISELIEVTRVPEIILSHPDDIGKSAVELNKIINPDETGENDERK